jgi:hypothetical protein
MKWILVIVGVYVAFVLNRATEILHLGLPAATATPDRGS